MEILQLVVEKLLFYGASTGADQPIDQDGQMTITGGTLFAAGSNEMGGVTATNSQNKIEYKNTIASGKYITVTDSSNNQVFSLQNKKEVNYVYFTSSGSGLTLNIGDSQTSTTSDSTTTNPTNPTNTTDTTDIIYYINTCEMIKISILLSLFLLYLN